MKKYIFVIACILLINYCLMSGDMSLVILDFEEIIKSDSNVEIEIKKISDKHYLFGIDEWGGKRICIIGDYIF